MISPEVMIALKIGGVIAVVIGIVAALIVCSKTNGDDQCQCDRCKQSRD